uniref:Nuclear transport factor 2 n=1 Tax=Noctiluca scintillans TaxID=2966 RepID=A0A7S1AI45_NOCSC|mmetsp:Transcript_47283/g.125535  ORF Transcript_47283/g.125535 Transcript_47283/m.125535 type:complete len:129 (+) Transcript_47283:78-464(+)|eukprot:CAMPEP_0194483964 /NCGR_PEP_ID=MMETSP0253-20130528/5446_1 /TAXON_ID=2966 /ORGANISM="Noctiluca scintillans" /LENGTH=128 /DNA_ID=CAMNT_0039323701 /DNA_START=75 /DNA_END=461 /DNA_ORIENTATION=-
MAAATNFVEIGTQFVQHYYQTFDSNRTGLQPLYADTSMLSWEDEQVQGVNNIVQKLVTLNGIKTVRHQVKNVDCQPSPPHNGILVFVTGNIFVDDNQNPLKFAQTFHLCQSPQGNWFVQNDMFRLNIG